MSHDAPLPARPGATGRQVAVLVAQIGFGLVAMTLPLPSMQQWGAIFGAGQASVQLAFSAFVVAFGGMQLVYGPLSDRVGRRRVLMVGLALAWVGSVLGALAGSLQLVIVARVIQGAGAAAGSVVCRAMVQDLFHGSERTRVMAGVGMAMGLCPPLATIVGGQLHVRWGWASTFWLAAALAAVLMAAAWRWLPDLRPRSPPQGRWWPAMRQAYAALARERSFRCWVGVLGLASATFYAFLSGAPLVLGSQGVGPGGIGFYIMVVPLSYIGGNFAASRLVRRRGEGTLMALGQAATLAGIALCIALALAGWRHPLAFVGPLVLLGIGHGLLMPAVLAGIVGTLPALAGAAAAVGGLMQQLVGAFGAWMVGLVPHDGAANLGLLMLGFTAASVLVQLPLHRGAGLSRP